MRQNQSGGPVPQRLSKRRSGLAVERTPRMRGFGCCIPGKDRPKTITQVVTVPLPNVWQQVSQVLGADHYKRLAHVIVGVEH